MRKRFKKFLHSGFDFETGEKFLQYRFTLLNSILLINVFVSLLFIFLSLFNINNLGPYTLMYALFFVLMLGLIITLRLSKRYYRMVMHTLVWSAFVLFTIILIVITNDEFRIVWFLLLTFAAFMFGGKRTGLSVTVMSVLVLIIASNLFDLHLSTMAVDAAILSIIIGAIMINSYTAAMNKFVLELDESKKMAEASAHAKAEFLASMSHEIRTPMNGVTGMLSLLLHSKLTETQRYQIDIAQSSANSLLTLINDILDFSKVDAGKLELEYINFNLRNELGDFADSVAYRAEQKGIELILDLTEVEHSVVRTDPGRLRQILTNIVGNAIKFTHEGEILIKASLTVEDLQTGRLQITVSDTGLGIPEDKMETLFDTFTQVDASTTRKYGGTGLGLAIVKKLTQLMGGTIHASSELGSGSIFSFSISVGLDKNVPRVMPQASLVDKRILIVDDNATNREVLQGQLEHWGMHVTNTQSAAEAEAVCRDNMQAGIIPPFDIAFLDMQMPEVDGVSLGISLRSKQEYDGMKMVMMTSLGSRSEASFFAERGFDAFFPKPTTTKDLFHALNVLVDNGDALDQADPLVTKDYLGTLQIDESLPKWPENTRILLVEDNRTNQLVVNGMLETLGLSADVANNGLEALDAIKSASKTSLYTLILMDCQMPEMDGYEASQAIRSGKSGDENRKLPIIAMTANAMKGDREKCILNGMDDYISKPLNPLAFKEMLIKWLIHTPYVAEAQ